jgi:hypothetical protein
MERDQKIALAAAAVAAAAEIPISQKYAIDPPVSTPTRMLVAGGMTYVSVLVASRLLVGK